MRDVEKRLKRLEGRVAARSQRVAVIDCNHAEDETLVIAAWEAEHPKARADHYILRAIFAEPPRDGFATRDTVLGALPGVKRFGEQSGEVDVESWRAWAKAAGMDYGSILTSRRPYPPPQNRAGSAQTNDQE